MVRVMATQHIFGGRFQRMLRRPEEHTPVAKTIQKNPLAATLCRFNVSLNALTAPLPRTHILAHLAPNIGGPS